jgi:hypothetical protein
MNTHFWTAAAPDHPSELVKGTDRCPANSGLYRVTFNDGTTSEEWYTVAFGWNRLSAKREFDIVTSEFIQPYPKY